MIFPSFPFTSAGGQLATAAVVMFVTFAPITTATPTEQPAEQLPAYLTTNAGTPLHTPAGPSTGSAITELRSVSGLTWEQLAGLLQVSRRALHFWATDKQMHPANELRLQRLLSAIRRIDRGSSSENRALLFAPLEDGVMPYDLLRDGQFEEAVERLGERRAAVQRATVRPSNEEHERRRPPPPAEMLGALQDTIHKEAGRVVRAKPVRRKRST